eukprot:scpid26526/ scgid24448/ RNA-directed DNA polymerase from mobile element jockey; Reverse transcriptase
MRVFLTNAFGLLSKFGDFQHALNAHKPDVAIVTETKFTPDKCTASESTIPGYGEPLRMDCTAQGGGVAIWCKSTLAVAQIDLHATPVDSKNAVLWCTIQSQSGSDITLGAVYRSGSSGDSDVSLLEHLDHCLDAVPPSAQVILAGDLNVHSTEWLGSTKTTTAGQRLEEICATHGLIQHVDQPTRGKNTLDLILSNLPHPVTVQAFPPLGKSDHCVILAEFSPVTLRTEPVSRRRVWRYNQADWGRMRHFIRQTDWQHILSHHPEHACVQLTSRIQEGMDRFIPSKHLSVRTCDPVWWTPECSTAVSARNRAWRHTRAHPTDLQLSDTYTATSLRVATVLHAAQQAHVSSLRNKLSNGNLRDKAWWSNMKRAGGLSRTSDIPVLKGADGQQCTTASSKADCFASFFAEKCSIPNDLTEDTLPPFPPRTDAILSQIRFRESAVLKQLRCLEVSKASGPDSISCRVLKECASELSKPLSQLFSSCLSHGYQPTAWKVANVVPIHKRKAKGDVRNYRPVSLLCVVSKVMERIVNQQLINHLNSNTLLSANQFGFRKSIGTADLLTSLQHEWALTTSKGGTIQALAIDIAGAFDRVSHPGLLCKLRGYGIGGQLLAWLTSYLQNRKLQAVVGGQTSTPSTIRSGVPQGSILGPTLFLVYINDAEDQLPASVSIAVYADDTTLYTSVMPGQTTEAAAAALQTAVNQLEAWGSTWRVTFEPSKSQLMSVTRKLAPPDFPPVQFLGTPVPVSSQLKLLGVVFDEKLNFSAHLHQLSVRAHQRLHFMRKAAPILDAAGRLTVYKGFVRPILEYAPLAWLGAAQTHLGKLDTAQRKAMQMIGPTTVLQSLRARRTVAGLSYLYKVVNCKGPPRLTRMRPPPKPRADTVRTRQQHYAQRQHREQLLNTTPGTSPDYLRRSFPYCFLELWNSLPEDVFPRLANHSPLTAFKKGVNKHISDQPWSWDVL